MDKINIFTFKWGDKYGPEYVNKLFDSLGRFVGFPFSFTCITDDTDGLNSDIGVIDYLSFDPFDYPKHQIFTREKLVLMHKANKGRNIWLDLDLLIHEDITEEITKEIQKPTFIWNHWNPLPRSYDWYGKGASCHVNSSFVMWDGNMGDDLWKLLTDFEEEAFFTYKSLDKFLFYQAHRKGMIDYWDEGFVSNYNREGFQKKGKISIFNTSHLKYNKGLVEVAYELDEVKEGWAHELWTNLSSA